MEKIKGWDLWVLDNVFQRAANWVWEKVPISCFQLAKICLLIHCTCFSIFSLLENKHVVTVMVMDMALEIFVFVTGFSIIYTGEKISTPKFLNRYREDLWIWRIWMILSVVVWISKESFYLEIGDVFNTCWIYFVSCTPRPPISRTRESSILVFAK